MLNHVIRSGTESYFRKVPAIPVRNNRRKQQKLVADSIAVTPERWSRMKYAFGGQCGHGDRDADAPTQQKVKYNINRHEAASHGGDGLCPGDHKASYSCPKSPGPGLTNVRRSPGPMQLSTHPAQARHRWDVPSYYFVRHPIRKWLRIGDGPSTGS